MAPAMITDTSWEDLEQRVTDAVVRITTLEHDDPNKPSAQKELGELLYLQFQLSNDPEYLDEAVSWTKEAIQTMPASTPLLGECLVTLAALLSAKYQHTKIEELQQSHLLNQELHFQGPEELSNQIEQLSMVLTAIPDDYKNLPVYQNLLAQIYFDHSLRVGDGRSLDSAVTFAKKAVESTIKSDNNREPFEKTYQEILMHQNSNRGMSILEAMKLSHVPKVVARYILGGVMSLFNDFKEILGHLMKKWNAMNLAISIESGNILLTEYIRSRKPAVIDRAIKAFENSITDEGLSDDSLRAQRLHGLAGCFEMRYKFEGAEEDLHKALAFAEEAKILVPADDLERKSILRELAILQKLLYKRTNQAEYIDNAIENSREAVRLAQNDDGDKILFFHALSTALQLRYVRFNNLQDSEAAEEIIQHAITSASCDRKQQARLVLVIEHANMLHVRYQKTTNLDYLELAIKKAIGAKNLLAADPLFEHHHNFSGVYAGIGSMYYSKFCRLKFEEDIRQAVAFTRHAVEIAPRNGFERGELGACLASQLGRLYDLTGNIEELETGIRLIRETISSLPAEQASIPGIKTSLASLLWRRIRGPDMVVNSLDQFTSTSKRDDLNEAIECFEQTLKACVETGRDYENFSILAELLSLRAILNQNPADMERAQNLFLEGVENATIAPLDRVGNVRVAILLPQITNERKDMLARIALDLLPYACNRELSREDQQHAIELTHGFAADICSLSIQFGNIKEALQRVEYGRGMILGHLIDRKDDLAVLKEKHPDFARKYQELRNTAFHQIKTEKLSESWESMIEDRRKAHSMMRECEKEIRRTPGFENFQQPPRLEELQKSARDGPVIIVNISNISSDAIILTTSHLKTIPLPDMTKDVPETFQRMLGRYRSRARSFLELHRNVEKDVNEPHSTQLLTWLWYSCVLPVLVKLQELDALPKASSDPPRVWWIGSGAASSLPFHAAGDFAKLCQLKRGPDQDLGGLHLTCMGWVTPSYAPTIKALQYARARANNLNLAKKPSVLVVAMPETPGQSNLTGVVDEKLAVQESATGFCVESQLECPSTEQVLERLQGSSVAHFACHGMSDSTNPDASHILLQRRDSAGKIVPDQLTVGAILDATTQSESGSWLVYLSACSTAQVKAKNMGDENIHLASAFQVAGFAHAIGSLWSAEDNVCVEVARHFYEELSKYSGEERKFAVAYALRKAVMSVRSQHYHNPALWAPFIHFGA